MNYWYNRGMERQTSPSDGSDDEWSVVAPYLTLMTEDAPQREHNLRDVFNGLHWIVRTGVQRRMMPHNLLPWAAVYQQTRRWLKAGAFEAIVTALHVVLRPAGGRNPQPSAAIVERRTLQSLPDSEQRTGDNRSSNVHLTVDTPGYLVTAHKIAIRWARLAPAVQDITGEYVELVCVDQGSPACVRPWK
jgi:transposase